MRSGWCTRDYDPAISTLTAHGLRGIVPGARRVLGRRAFRTSVPDRLAPILHRPIVSVVGDSHAAIYNRMRRQGQLPGVWLDALSVPGATAFGLANPNSSTNALTRFSAFLDRTPRHRRTLFVLGEVDCGFLIWHRSMTNGTSVQSEFEQSLRRYTGFLEEQMAKGHDRLGVVSVAPSTIDDYARWKGLDSARSKVTASIEERTELTVAYNHELAAWAERTSSAFMDLDPDLLDPSTGLVASRFIHGDPSEHHLDPDALSEVLVERIQELLASGW